MIRVKDALLAPTGLCRRASGRSLFRSVRYGTPLPLLVISPCASRTRVSHTRPDTTSVLGFIERNWNLGTHRRPVLRRAAGSILRQLDFIGESRPKVVANPATGEVTRQGDN